MIKIQKLSSSIQISFSVDKRRDSQPEGLANMWMELENRTDGRSSSVKACLASQTYDM